MLEEHMGWLSGLGPIDRRRDVFGLQISRHEQLEIVSPSLVVLLGAVAARTFVDSRPVLKDLRGRLHKLGGRRFLVTYHPAAAMHFPVAAEGIHEDFKRLKTLLG